MNRDNDMTTRSELAAFRAQAEQLGLDDVDTDIPHDLESADDFIARMKALDEDRRPSAPRGSVRRRWTTGLVAVAAAALAVAFVLRPGGDPVVADTPPVLDFEFSSAVRIAYAPGEDPNSTLTALAGAAESDTAPGSGPIQHHVTDSWFSDQDDRGGAVITPRVTETWLRPDGSLTTRDAVGTQLTADGRGIPTDGPSYSTDPATSTLPAGTVDAGFVASLSTDPTLLRDQLLDHIGCQDRALGSARSFCLYNEVATVFAGYVVEPALAEAMWTMLRGETGFTSLGTVTDRAGRTGMGISLIPDEQPTRRFVLIGSTDTGQLLGTEELLIKDDPGLDVEAPSVVSFSTIVSAERTTDDPAA